SLPLALSKSGSEDGKSARRAPSAGFRARLRSSRGIYLHAAPLEFLRPGYKLGPNGQLVRRQLHRFGRRRQVNTCHFEHHAPRLYYRHPVLRWTFAFSHSSFGGLLREWLVRKNPYPQFSAALDKTRDRHTRRFNLPVGNPRRLERLQSVLAKRQRSAAPRLTAAPAALLLAVLHLLRHQHNRSPVSLTFYLSCCGRSGLPALGNLFALVDPALHANHSVSRLRFGGAKIDIRAQRLQRQPPLQVPFFACDFGAVQAARHAHFDAFATKA